MAGDRRRAVDQRGDLFRVNSSWALIDASCRAMADLQQDVVSKANRIMGAPKANAVRNNPRDSRMKASLKFAGKTELECGPCMI